TGYDAIILEGAATEPVYLEINDQVVLFHSAAQHWGKDTFQTEDAILAEVGQPESQALAIGPAGENLVRFACIENNYWRSAGRTGVGAVMGSKNVKAIVFYGQAKVQLADPELFAECLQDLAAKAKDNPAVTAYRKYGTTGMVSTMNGVRAFPSRYWSQGQMTNWEKISGDQLHAEFTVKSSACPKCFLHCGKTTTVNSGRHQGLTLEGPEYETLYAFGGLCGIDQLAEIIYLNDLCDRLGMDTITTGNLLALVMEAGQQGRLDTTLQYGDAEGAAELIRAIATGSGIGQILARGIKYASQEWDLTDLAIHVKGLEPPGYEPRRLHGMGLAYAVSTRGACHLRATFYKPELAGMIDPKAVEGKAELFIDYENRLTIFNTGILCVFYRDFLLWPDLQKLVKAVTGWEYTEEELKTLANRVVSLTRTFNAREGATKAADTLPPRFFREAINDGKDFITEDELQFLVDEYYRLRGWDDAGYSKATESSQVYGVMNESKGD
ncbi:MAG TPA: aldehyde ferredoxin oxidoreductase C-terminal domain-containing protein, partial [Bacillota bacterium]|nr:aldehyde ferredoxin oxidoreductase C-terminal domain-containing protein [Bacillota bacterium]